MSGYTRTKYIVILDKHGVERIFTFSADISHNYFFEVVQGIRQGMPQNWTRPYMNAECVAAGFVTPEGKCQGYSESLGVQSRPHSDTVLLGLKCGVPA